MFFSPKVLTALISCGGEILNQYLRYNIVASAQRKIAKTNIENRKFSDRQSFQTYNIWTTVLFHKNSTTTKDGQSGFREILRTSPDKLSRAASQFANAHRKRASETVYRVRGTPSRKYLSYYIVSGRVNNVAYGPGGVSASAARRINIADGIGFDK